MGETDQTLRRLLRDLPEPLLQLAFPRRSIRALGPVDASVDRPRKLLADNLVRCKEGRQELVVHAEIEQKWRPELPRRLYDYNSAAHTATGLPVVSVLVLLRRGGRPPPTRGIYRIEAAGQAVVAFRYRVLELFALDARKMKRRLAPAAWPFLVPMQGATVPFVTEVARDLAEHRGLNDRAKATTSRLLMMVTAGILGSRAARKIAMWESLLESQGVKDFLESYRAEGRTEGEAKGRTEGEAKGRTEGEAKGRTEGEAKGRAEGFRGALRRVLDRRGFALDPEHDHRIAAETDLERLDRWLERAVTCTTVADVFTRD